MARIDLRVWCVAPPNIAPNPMGTRRVGDKLPLDVSGGRQAPRDYEINRGSNLPFTDLPNRRRYLGPTPYRLASTAPVTDGVRLSRSATSPAVPSPEFEVWAADDFDVQRGAPIARAAVLPEP